jgi:hypothetical protein
VVKRHSEDRKELDKSSGNRGVELATVWGPSRPAGRSLASPISEMENHNVDFAKRALAGSNRPLSEVSHFKGALSPHQSALEVR